MEYINKSIEYALNTQPDDFKASINAALADKIADAIQLRKIEIGGYLLKDKEETTEPDNNFRLEDNLDEEL